jgi:hypothetical protein
MEASGNPAPDDYGQAEGEEHEGEDEAVAEEQRIALDPVAWPELDLGPML